MKWNVIRVMMGFVAAAVFGMTGCGGGSSNNAQTTKQLRLTLALHKML